MQSDLDSCESIAVGDMFSKPFTADNFFYFTTTTGERRIQGSTVTDSDDVFVDDHEHEVNEHDSK